MNSAADLDAEVRQMMHAGRLREAAAKCDELNQQHPEYLRGWVTASQLALALGEAVIALRAIDRALQLAPGRPELLLQRIECLAAYGDIEAAVSVARQLDDHQFETASAAAAFGLVLTGLKMHAEARRHYLKACELEPAESQHYYNLAAVERFLGNQEAAVEAVNRCIELCPDDADALLLRSGLRVQTSEQNNIESLLHAHEMLRNESRARSKVCYALSRELEDIADFPKAFAFLSEGAGLVREGIQYTPQNDLETMREIRAVYTSDVFEQDTQGHVSVEPVFVIGMPRTGTTLVERILASHSAVRSAGELQTFAIELVRHCRKATETPATTSKALVGQSTDIDFEALGEDYVRAARPVGERKAHFVDKLPLNFLYAGLIHLALPRAKIVLLERDPMDTCYAVYKAMFKGAYPFSYDLEELANYFVEYRKLVEHWEDAMPGVMHTVSYERLVTDPVPVIENLLTYCNLSYEEACRRFFESSEASTTASADAVRRDFFTSSIGKWRNYEEQLRPAAEILGSAQ